MTTPTLKYLKDLQQDMLEQPETTDMLICHALVAMGFIQARDRQWWRSDATLYKAMAILHDDSKDPHLLHQIKVVPQSGQPVRPIYLDKLAQLVPVMRRHTGCTPNELEFNNPDSTAFAPSRTIYRPLSMWPYYAVVRQIHLPICLHVLVQTLQTWR